MCVVLARHTPGYLLPPIQRLNNRMANCCLSPLQIFESAVVRRVDEGLGLLCELPAEGQGALPLAPGYAHISNLADSKV